MWCYGSHGVVLALVQDILRVPEMSMIWKTLPRGMTSMIHHIFGAINLIDILRDHSHVSHDSTPSNSSPNRFASSTLPHGPPPDHASSPHVSAPSIDLPYSPPHVSTPSTSC
jgi:hypothetical protein